MIRIYQMAIALILVCWITGCRNNPQDDQHIKINDLAPQDQNSVLKTVSFELQVSELPADNLNQLDEIRQTLETRPFRYSSELAFSSNFFSVYYGRLQSLATINSMLAATSTQKITSMTMLMNESLVETIPVNAINFPQVISFISSNGTEEAAHVGPGLLGLRFKTEKAEDANERACNLTAYPVFAVPSGNTIPQLDERLKMREFPFISAAFGLKMRVGDFILLAPEKYTGSRPDFLCSLFFNNPAGSLFFGEDKRRPPVLKPSVRFYILICTRIDIR
jgi:hypothetical protein